ncbi:neprilysin-2-like [Ixodes scapularis]
MISEQPAPSEVSIAQSATDNPAIISANEVSAENNVGEADVALNTKERARYAENLDFPWSAPLTQKVTIRKGSSSLQPMSRTTSVDENAINSGACSPNTERTQDYATIKTADSSQSDEPDMLFMKEGFAGLDRVKEDSKEEPQTKNTSNKTLIATKTSAYDGDKIAVAFKERKTKDAKESIQLSDALIPPGNIPEPTLQADNPQKTDISVKVRRTKRKKDVLSKRTIDATPVTTRTATFLLDEQRRTNKSEICLFALVILAVIIITAFILLFMKFKTKGEDKPEFGMKLADTCSSLSCIQNAAFLGNLLFWDVNPCDNFYMFVCNHWANQLPISVGAFTISIDDDYAGDLEDIMFSLLAQGKQTGVTQAIGKLFEQCQNAKQIEEDGWSPLLDLLSQVELEGFPFTPPIRKLPVWKLAAKVLRKTGVAAFFGVGITSYSPQGKDIVALRVPETFSSTDGADISEAIRSYTGAVQASLKALKKDFIPSDHSRNVVRFAGQLERLCLLYSKEQELQQFEKMVQQTDTLVVMNFLSVRLIIQVSPFLPDVDLLDVYSSLVYRKLQLGVPRWKLCVRTIERALPPPFLYLSFSDVRDHKLEAKLADLVIEIRKEFLNGIESADYLNEASKVIIRSLISKTKLQIFSAPWTRDKKLLEEFVGKVPSSSRQSLDTYVMAHEYAFVDMLRRKSSEQWPRSAFSTSCWYDPGSRTIYVPVLVFNVSLAQSEEMPLLQLSRAGIRIGRCIFEMLISEAGSPHATEQWLNEDTRSRIATLQRCTGGPQGPQNMAVLRDASVTRFAFNHFQKVYNSSGKQLRLRLAPNRDLDAQQLFFIYLVLQTCERRAAGGASTRTSSVAWNAAIRHQRGFHDAFHCVRGSAMNPEQSCDF